MRWHRGGTHQPSNQHQGWVGFPAESRAHCRNILAVARQPTNCKWGGPIQEEAGSPPQDHPLHTTHTYTYTQMAPHHPSNCEWSGSTFNLKAASLTVARKSTGSGVDPGSKWRESTKNHPCTCTLKQTNQSTNWGWGDPCQAEKRHHHLPSCTPNGASTNVYVYVYVVLSPLRHRCHSQRRVAAWMGRLASLSRGTGGTPPHSPGCRWHRRRAPRDRQWGPDVRCHTGHTDGIWVRLGHSEWLQRAAVKGGV